MRISFLSKRCRLCGMPHAAILSDHERDHIVREYDEARRLKAAFQELLEEQRQHVEGMRAILAAMGTPPELAP